FPPRIPAQPSGLSEYECRCVMKKFTWCRHECPGFGEIRLSNSACSFKKRHTLGAMEVERPPMPAAAGTLAPAAIAALQETGFVVGRDSTDWRLLGFIPMIDAFTPENGATRFIPGSHHWGDPPRDGPMQEHTAQLVSACGPAGSLLVFNGSTWHGQGINGSDQS